MFHFSLLLNKGRIKSSQMNTNKGHSQVKIRSLFNGGCGGFIRAAFDLKDKFDVILSWADSLAKAGETKTQHV